jgi:hypothetical protein
MNHKKIKGLSRRALETIGRETHALPGTNLNRAYVLNLLAEKFRLPSRKAEGILSTLYGLGAIEDDGEKTITMRKKAAPYLSNF